MVENAAEAREAVRQAVAEAYAPYQKELKAILARAVKIENHYLLSEEDKPEDFLKLRLEAITAGAQRMKEALEEHPGILSEEERQPKDDSPNGYQKSGPLFEDKEHGFFAYAFAFGSHQVTVPHNHPGPCVSLSWQGDTLETVFLPNEAGDFRPVRMDLRAEGAIGAPIGPMQEADMHTIRNPDPHNPLILVHLYDGFMLEELQEGIVRSQFDVRKVPNGVYDVDHHIPGEYPIRKDKINTGESPIQLASDAEWTEKILRSPGVEKTRG